MYIGTTLGDVDPNITTFPEALETQLRGVDRLVDTSGIEKPVARDNSAPPVYLSTIRTNT